MKVMYPFTSIRAEAWDALHSYYPGFQAVDVSSTPWAYAQAIEARLDDDLVIVEHDIVIHADVIPAFESCPNPWCLFPYRIKEHTNDFAIGCVRFRKEIWQKADWHLLHAIGQIIPHFACQCHTGPAHCWRHIDWSMYYLLTDAGYKRCIHRPAVEHLHEYPPAPGWEDRRFADPPPRG